MKPCIVCRLEINEPMCKYCGTPNDIPLQQINVGSLTPQESNLEHLLDVGAKLRRGRPRKAA